MAKATKSPKKCDDLSVKGERALTDAEIQRFRDLNRKAMELCEEILAFGYRLEHRRPEWALCSDEVSGAILACTDAACYAKHSCNRLYGECRVELRKSA